MTSLASNKAVTFLEKVFPVLALSISVVSIFASCKKDVSCEECKDQEVRPTPISGPEQINHPPIANGGPTQTISLPLNTVVLDGSGSSDPDNNITHFAWTILTGPSMNLEDPNAIKTKAYGLVEGIYQYVLEVTDSAGLSDRDTVQVVVFRRKVTCTDCKIVFVSERDGNPEIYSCSIDGSNVKRLTNNTGRDEEPVWSPDGSKIAFVSNRSKTSHIYVMNADGSNVIQRTFAEPYDQYNPTFSPDGTKIAYEMQSDGSTNIWVVDASSGSPALLFAAPGYDAQPAWSPDGSTIAIVSDWAAYDFVYDIYMIYADGSGFTPITGNIFDNHNYIHPSWSPDGTKLAFNVISRIDTNNYTSRIAIMNADGSNLNEITTAAAYWSNTSWSADGTWIAYTLMSGSQKDVAWVSADGTRRGTIVSDGWNADCQH